jgi:hypothetical protein
MALAALGAVAVLDVGSRTAEAAPDASPFAGSWSGTWAHVEDDAIGTWDEWTISDAGRITGEFYSTTNSFGGAIVGHVDADGRLVMIAGHNDEPAGGSGWPFQGTAVIDGDGKLVVSVVGPWFSLVGILERN